MFKSLKFKILINFLTKNTHHNHHFSVSSQLKCHLFQFHERGSRNEIKFSVVKINSKKGWEIFRKKSFRKQIFKSNTHHQNKFWFNPHARNEKGPKLKLSKILWDIIIRILTPYCNYCSVSQWIYIISCQNVLSPREWEILFACAHLTQMI